MSKYVTLLLAVFLLGLCAQALFAADEDIIILKEGGMYKGEIISQVGSVVKIKVKGKIISVKKRDIRKIITKPKPAKEYKKRAKEIARKDVSGQFALAQWCRDNGLEKEAVKHFRLAVKIDPDHEGARLALGFAEYEGEWRLVKDLEEMGLVSFDGKWIQKEALGDAVRERRKARLEGLEAHLQRSEEALEEVAAGIGFDPPLLKIRGDLLYKRFHRDRTRLFIVREALTNLLSLPFQGHEVCAAFVDGGADLDKIFAFLVDRAGGDLDPEQAASLFQAPNRGGNVLFAAVAALGEAAGKPYEGEARATIRSRCERIPAPFRDALGRLVNRFTHAAVLRKKAFEDVVIEDLIAIVARADYGADGKLMESLEFAKEAAFMENFLLLAEAARVLMRGAAEFTEFMKTSGLAEGVARRGELIRLDTPFGRIVVGGKGDNTYAEPIALLIDLGGNDTYQAAAGSSAAAPDTGVGLLIDLAGDDRYLATKDDAFGAGYFGVGIHFDLEGNDTYSCTGYSLGAAFMGCGVLYDAAGDDSYECGTCGEGYALFGYGLLVDGGGKDQYQIAANGQGFGGTLGAGLLLDLDGDDAYIAGSGLKVDALNPEASACYAQGAARGYERLPKIAGPAKRPSDEEAEEISVSGGWGVLADLGGNDTYQAKRYAQGAAFFSGLGMLLDWWGDDRYEATQVAQGAGSGLGVGLLFDGSGDDTYFVQAMGQGFAMNFALGALVDCFGDDHYQGAALSQGCSQALNCLGFLLECEGKDRYDTSESGLGFSSDYDPAHEGGFKTLGVFLDLGGGNDSYRGRKDAKNNARWIQESDIGIGEDQ